MGECYCGHAEDVHNDDGCDTYGCMCEHYEFALDASPCHLALTPRLVVRREDYSAGPWRIVDAVTGSQVGINEVFDHPNLGMMQTTKYGFDTKAQATETLGVLAGGWWAALQTANSQRDALQAQLSEAVGLLRPLAVTPPYGAYVRWQRDGAQMPTDQLEDWDAKRRAAEAFIATYEANQGE